MGRGDLRGDFGPLESTLGDTARLGRGRMVRRAGGAARVGGELPRVSTLQDNTVHCSAGWYSTGHNSAVQDITLQHCKYLINKFNDHLPQER